MKKGIQINFVIFFFRVIERLFFPFHLILVCRHFLWISWFVAVNICDPSCGGYRRYFLFCGGCVVFNFSAVLLLWWLGCQEHISALSNRQEVLSRARQSFPGLLLLWVYTLHHRPTLLFLWNSLSASRDNAGFISGRIKAYLYGLHFRENKGLIIWASFPGL